MEGLDKKRAIATLWNAGVVNWKLDNVQKELYASYHNAKLKTIVWSCSRRLGKSFALCVLAIEASLKKPNSVVKYIAPNQKHVKMIIRPLLKQILNDCPRELKPKFHTHENIYRFANGSEIQLAGTDQGHAESLRGGSADLCIIDEAGFCNDLRYIVQSILIPTTTTTRGKVILSSTPPISPDHEFVEYMKNAEFKGTFVKKTIYDGLGSRITQEIIDEMIEELGGVHTVAFRREYLCELIKDEDYAVIPEFTDDLETQIVKEWARPVWYDGYVGGDIGFKDLSVFLFAYYDFKNAKLIIEDELVMNGRRQTTEALARGIKDKEEAIFRDKMTGETQKPYLRVCDNNLIVINDLHVLHGLTFLPTAKDDSEAALNNVRIMLKQGRIVINPRCKTLLFHLKHATWNKSRKSYDRSPDAGHYDAVDALKYLVRNVQYAKNPYPAHFGRDHGDNWYVPEEAKQNTTTHNAIRKIFKLNNKY